MKDARTVFGFWLSIFTLAGSLIATPALADEYSDVGQLTKVGKHAEALAKADQFLSAQPKDAQMRFLRGVVLYESGKNSEAASVFTRLTEEFPDLPEPYNNLAVLYANQGQFDRARNTLEAAIKTNPSYSTAYENLGDVYARLASQAYVKALQLEGTNTTAGPKLNLIRDLFATSIYRLPKAAAPATGAAVAQTPPAPPAPIKPVTPAAPTPAPASPVAQAQPKPPANPVASAPVAKAPEPEAPAAKPVANESAAVRDVEAAVRAWATAWSSKDVRGYLGAYGKEFDPPGNASRSAWEEERKQRITSKGSIAVKLEGLKVTVDGNRATAKFRQDYKSGGLSVSSRKTLELQKSADKWKIVKESVGS